MRTLTKWFFLSAALFSSAEPIVANPSIGPGIALGVPAPIPGSRVRIAAPLRTPRAPVPRATTAWRNLGTHSGIQAGENARRPHAIGGPAAAFSAGGGAGAMFSPHRLIGVN